MPPQATAAREVYQRLHRTITQIVRGQDANVRRMLADLSCSTIFGVARGTPRFGTAGESFALRAWRVLRHRDGVVAASGRPRALVGGRDRFHF